MCAPNDLGPLVENLVNGRGWTFQQIQAIGRRLLTRSKWAHRVWRDALWDALEDGNEPPRRTRGSSGCCGSSGSNNDLEDAGQAAPGAGYEEHGSSGAAGSERRPGDPNNSTRSEP